jgi:hypothetical protein
MCWKFADISWLVEKHSGKFSSNFGPVNYFKQHSLLFSSKITVLEHLFQEKHEIFAGQCGRQVEALQ